MLYDKTFRKTDSEDQFAAFKMSFVVIPILAALDDEAPLTEWALKMLASMPESSSKDLSQQATVLG